MTMTHLQRWAVGAVTCGLILRASSPASLRATVGDNTGRCVASRTGRIGHIQFNNDTRPPELDAL